MQPSRLEITANGVPAGQFTKFAWHKDGKYLLRLKRIEVSVRQGKPAAAYFSAIAHYTYFVAIEKHTGYVLVTINLFGRSWLINIGKRQFYVERIQETE